MRTLCALLLILPGLVLAADEKPAPTERAAPSPAGQAQARQQRVAEASDPDQVRWLEADGQRFLALYSANLSADSKGGVLIVHGEALQPGWPTSLSRLRETLPLSGWHALALGLAPPAPTPPPARVLPAFETAPSAAKPRGKVASEDAQATARANAAAPDLPAPAASPPADPGEAGDAQARIASGVAFLRGLGIESVVIVGEGRGALAAARYLQGLAPAGEDGTGGIPALVLVDPDHQDAGAGLSLTACIKALRIPTLDIATGYAPRAREQARERQRAARSLPAGRYQQVQVPPAAGGLDNPTDRISQRISGWIDSRLGGEDRAARP
ncbi:MAG TPA: DUF3530 family protein [Spongiibacteraceae bacterium]|jgi:hypothetical protein|nr:DUF3530 family protein [Spongiibacteraceae bacterium]HUH38688.1 DUF3530 family protein [Spongiibacteraceae bacterium]